MKSEGGARKLSDHICTDPNLGHEFRKEGKNGWVLKHSVVGRVPGMHCPLGFILNFA